MQGLGKASGGGGSGYWEHFPHVSDVGIRGVGPSEAEAFAQAAVALTAAVTDPEDVLPAVEVALRAEGQDDELLFLAWLDAVIFEMATRHMLFARFEVTLQDHGLTGRAWGETVDVQRHQPAAEVKAATFAELQVGQRADGSWIAQCVIDV